MGGRGFGFERSHLGSHQSLFTIAIADQYTVARFELGHAEATHGLHMQEDIFGPFATGQESESLDAIEPFNDRDFVAACRFHLNMRSAGA